MNFKILAFLVLTLSVHGFYAKVVIDDITSIEDFQFPREEYHFNEDIDDLRNITSQIKSQLRQLIEQHLSSNSATGLFINYLIRSNQKFITSFLSRLLDEGLGSLQGGVCKANDYFNSNLKKLMDNVYRALRKFAECCEEQEHYDIIVQTHEDIEKYIKEKVKEANIIFSGVELRLKDIQTSMRDLPNKFAHCLTSHRSNGFFSIPIVDCMRSIGIEIMANAPSAISLAKEGVNANRVIYLLVDSLIDLITNRIRATKKELSNACSDVANCIASLNIPFCT